MIRKLNLNDVGEKLILESFLSKQSNTLLYVSTDYLALLSNFLKETEVELWASADSNGTLNGYFPVAFRHNDKHGTVCNSLPFYGSNGGITIDRSLTAESGNLVQQQLLEAVLESAAEKKCVACTIITNPLDAEFNSWIKSNFRYDLTDQRIGQLTPLPDSESGDIEKKLLGCFEDPRPRNIRKALKENISVYHSYDREAFDFLYATHFENITSINGIPKEQAFFDAVRTSVPKERYRIYIAEKDGEKIAALLLFYYNKTVEYFTPAVIEKYRNLQASSLLIYQAMLDAVNEGYSWWNWGGTWLSQGGVYDFKKKWGTRDLPYFYYTSILNSSILEQSKETLLKEYPYFFVAPFDKLRAK